MHCTCQHTRSTQFLKLKMHGTLFEMCARAFALRQNQSEETGVVMADLERPLQHPYKVIMLFFFCWARRNRSEETGVEPAYLERLHQHHEDWLGPEILRSTAELQQASGRRRLVCRATRALALSHLGSGGGAGSTAPHRTAPCVLPALWAWGWPLRGAPHAAAPRAGGAVAGRLGDVAGAGGPQLGRRQWAARRAAGAKPAQQHQGQGALSKPSFLRTCFDQLSGLERPAAGGTEPIHGVHLRCARRPLTLCSSSSSRQHNSRSSPQ